MATLNILHFPKQSKSAQKSKQKKTTKKCTVLEWVRNGYTFPGKLVPSTEYLPKRPE